MNNMVAVYGTLKLNEGNHRVMQAAGGQFVQQDKTLEKFKMYGGYGFPRVVYDGNTSHIHVELFEVEDIELLDRLEGHPHFFERKLIELVNYSGEVWMYFHPPITNVNRVIQLDGNWSSRVNIHAGMSTGDYT